MQTLTKQDPPLVEIFGRPKKILLTPSGVELAKRLKSEAAESGKLVEKRVSEMDVFVEEPAGALPSLIKPNALPIVKPS